MKALLFAAFGAGLVRMWWQWRSRRALDGPLSPAWLVDQERRAWTSGQDGVSWRWPVRKITNEIGAWNASRLRKRAS